MYIYIYIYIYKLMAISRVPQTAGREKDPSGPTGFVTIY